MRPCKRGIKDLMCLALVTPLVWGISKKKKKKTSDIDNLANYPGYTLANPYIL